MGIVQMNDDGTWIRIALGDTERKEMLVRYSWETKLELMTEV